MDSDTNGMPTNGEIEPKETPEACDNFDDDQDESPELVSEFGFCPVYTLYGKCCTIGCAYIHGELCRQCGSYCMDPRDDRQRSHHHAVCTLEHTLMQDKSSAVEVSRGIVCNICLEVVLEKPARKRRFGLLENCNHTFCLSCIRKWRKSDTNEITRCCPICRTLSDFVFPSYFWIAKEEEKKATIKSYKNGCRLTDCKHFNKGSGSCPFGRKCFYRHALPSGELCTMQQQRPNRHFVQQNNFRVEHWTDQWELDDSDLWDE